MTRACACGSGEELRRAGSEERPVRGDYAVTTRCNLPKLERSSMAKNTRWDRNLSVASDGEGLIGHAGAVLLRKLADQCGLTSALGAALRRAGTVPLSIAGWRWSRWRWRSRSGRGA